MDYSGKIIRKTPVTPSQTSASGVWSLDEALQAQRTNTWPIAGVPNPISRSLRFRSGASAYLNRTPASASNRKTWTFSAWVKRGQLGAIQTLFCAGTSNGVSPFETRVAFLNTDQLFLTVNGNASIGGDAVTNAVFRDPSAWYHIVAYVDMSASGQANKARLYVNGVLQSVSYTNFGTTDDTQVNNNVIHRIGANSFALSNFADCYLTEINFIDGQALTPSSFGMTDPQTGVWEPLKYSGTYGTNGFYLPFSDNSSVAALGTDFSGNSNTWTVNNISLTSGSTYDSMLDVPTPWIGYNTGDVASVTRGNYAVLNPLNTPASVTCTNGNLNSSGGNYASACSSIAPNSGKWYIEFSFTSIGSSNVTIGVSNRTDREAFNGNTQTWQLGYTQGGLLQNAGSNNSGFATYTTNDVIGVSFDCAVGTATWYKNGTLVGSLTNSAFANVDVVFGAGGGGSAGSNAYWVNFGQRPFAYTPPAGFLALCTTNLPAGAIGYSSTTLASNYFDVATWTGANTSGGNSISSLSFSPDFVWAKVRSQAYSHLLYDRLRGTGATAELSTDSGTGEGGTTASERGYLNSFDTNGFSSVVGSNGDNLYFNQTSQTYVAWNWRANGAGVTNTAGSITSTVSANQSSGFSIVTYTGTGSASDTVGHGLGVVPAMVITKRRNATGNWMVKHISLASNNNLLLEDTIGQTNVTTGFSSGGIANLTSSTTFGFLNGTGGTPNNSNTNGGTYVAYCFAQVAGYSAFGSYTGNGSTDGPFVFCGFRPRFILVRSTSGSRNWYIWDTARNTFNVMNLSLYPNSSTAEITASDLTFDSVANGFKARGTSIGINNSGETYIYMAFAETPFKNALAR